MAADFVHPDACDEYRHVFCGCDGRNVVHAVFAVYVIAAAVLYYRQRPQVINELITFATEYGQVQKHLIQELALPYAVMDSQGKLLWVNKEFTKSQGRIHSIINVSPPFSGADGRAAAENEEETDINVAYGEKNFRAHVKASASTS